MNMFVLLEFLFIVGLYSYESMIIFTRVTVLYIDAMNILFLENLFSYIQVTALIMYLY